MDYSFISDPALRSEKKRGDNIALPVSDNSRFISPLIIEVPVPQKNAQISEIGSAVLHENNELLRLLRRQLERSYAHAHSLEAHILTLESDVTTYRDEVKKLNEFIIDDAKNLYEKFKALDKLKDLPQYKNDATYTEISKLIGRIKDTIDANDPVSNADDLDLIKELVEKFAKLRKRLEDQEQIHLKAMKTAEESRKDKEAKFIEKMNNYKQASDIIEEEILALDAIGTPESKQAVINLTNILENMKKSIAIDASTPPSEIINRLRQGGYKESQTITALYESITKLRDDINQIRLSSAKDLDSLRRRTDIRIASLENQIKSLGMDIPKIVERLKIMGVSMEQALSLAEESKKAQEYIKLNAKLISSVKDITSMSSATSEVTDKYISSQICQLNKIHLVVKEMMDAGLFKKVKPVDGGWIDFLSIGTNNLIHLVGNTIRIGSTKSNEEVLQSMNKYCRYMSAILHLDQNIESDITCSTTKGVIDSDFTEDQKKLGMLASIVKHSYKDSVVSSTNILSPMSVPHLLRYSFYYRALQNNTAAMLELQYESKNIELSEADKKVIEMMHKPGTPYDMAKPDFNTLPMMDPDYAARYFEAFTNHMYINIRNPDMKGDFIILGGGTSSDILMISVIVVMIVLLVLLIFYFASHNKKMTYVSV